MKRPMRFVGDVAQLPAYGHGHRSLTWWGTMGFVAIESMAFVLTIGIYLYLAGHTPEWPPHGNQPALTFGTTFLALIVLSIAPNVWLNRRARAENLSTVRLGLVVMSLVGLALLAIRVFEFPALGVSYKESAYGSVTVTLLGLHTTHLATDVMDTLVVTALMFTRHGRARRFVDVSDNAIYWNFVVVAWVPIYLVIYFGPRWL